MINRVLLKRSKNFSLSTVRPPPWPFVVCRPPSALYFSCHCPCPTSALRPGAKVRGSFFGRTVGRSDRGKSRGSFFWSDGGKFFGRLEVGRRTVGQGQSQGKFFLVGWMGGRWTADKKRSKNFVLGSPYFIDNATFLNYLNEEKNTFCYFLISNRIGNILDNKNLWNNPLWVLAL